MNFNEKKQNLESLLQSKLATLRSVDDSKNKLIEEIILIRGKLELLREIEKDDGEKQRQEKSSEDGGTDKGNSEGK